MKINFDRAVNLSALKVHEAAANTNIPALLRFSTRLAKKCRIYYGKSTRTTPRTSTFPSSSLYFIFYGTEHTLYRMNKVEILRPRIRCYEILKLITVQSKSFIHNHNQYLFFCINAPSRAHLSLHNIICEPKKDNCAQIYEL